MTRDEVGEKFARVAAENAWVLGRLFVSFYDRVVFRNGDDHWTVWNDWFGGHYAIRFVDLADAEECDG